MIWMRRFFLLLMTAPMALAAAPVVARTASDLNALASLSYQAAQTQVVSARLNDTKLLAMRAQVDASQSALAAARQRLDAARAAARQDKAAVASLTQRLDAALAELAAAKSGFVQELARRDSDYARDIAVLQMAGEQLLATAEGQQALALYNAGGPDAFAAADTVLAQVETARAVARAEAALMQQVEDRRVRARLALDARGRGLTTTAVAIARWEAVTELDRAVTRDWTNLSDLYLASGFLTKAIAAADRSLAAAKSDADRIIACDRLASARAAANDSAGALKALKIGEALARARLTAEPESPDAIRGVSFSLRELGGAAADQGDLLAANRLLRESLALDERRLLQAPSIEVRRDISVTLHSLALADLSAGRLAEALAQQQDVVLRDRAILAEDPQSRLSQRNLAVSLGNLAHIEGEFGRFTAALALTQEADAIYVALLTADPTSAEALEDRADSAGMLAWLLDLTGDETAAEKAQAEERALIARRAAIEPESAMAQRWASALLQWDASAAFNARRYADAAEGFAKSEAIRRRLLAADPVPRNQTWLASTIQKRGVALELAELFSEAEVLYRESLALLQAAETNDRSIDLQFSLAGTWDNLADVAAKQQDFVQAAQHARQAIAKRRAIIAVNGERRGKTGMAESMNRLATALQRVDKVAEALAIRREAIAIRRTILATSQAPERDRASLREALVTAALTASFAGDDAAMTAYYEEGLDMLRAQWRTDPASILEQYIFTLANYAGKKAVPAAKRLALLEERVAAFAPVKSRPGYDVWLADTLLALAAARSEARDKSRALADYDAVLALVPADHPTPASQRQWRWQIATKAAKGKAKLLGTAAAWRAAQATAQQWRASGALNAEDAAIVHMIETEAAKADPSAAPLPKAPTS
jgi:hypothetical protein